MAGYEGLPKCGKRCEFPDGVVPRYNCAGEKLHTDKHVVTERDAEGIEKPGSRWEFKDEFVACGNAALKGIDPFMAIRLGLIRRI